MSTSHLTKIKRKAAEFEQKKQFDKALSLYIQFVDEAGRDLDDADLQLFNRVGDLLTRQGNVTEALAYYEKAVDMYAERGFLNNAIALCNKILRQSPARTAVYYKLGRISASKGFKSDARKNFLEYADRMQKAGQREEAFRALKEFAELCPDQDDIRLMLADMLSKDSRSTEAIEQLEHLYVKQKAEGREAEARATADRIKAIDPDATPGSTGAFQAVKTNDLVFLDLTELAPVEPVASATPRSVTPMPPPDVIETVDVSGVAALSGLSITFLPDENELGSAPPDLDSIPLAGLESIIEEPADPMLELTASLAGLDEPGEAAEQPLASLLLDVEVPVFADTDEIVPHLDGLANAAVTLTGAHASMAPLIDEPPLSGAEFGEIVLESHDPAAPVPAHDLGLPSSLPRIDDLLVPDEPSALPMPLLDETPDAWVDAALSSPRDDFSLDRLLSPLDGTAVVHGEPAGLPVLEGDPWATLEEAPDPAPTALTASDDELPPVRDDASSTPEDVEVVASVDVAFDQLANAGALDTTGLRARFTGDAETDAALAREDAEMAAAFDEQRVELPLIDLENAAEAEQPAFEPPGEGLEDLLSSAAIFTDDPEVEFEPEPLDLDAKAKAETPPSIEEWTHPEVLIDGEWRDEHVGDLVSGEIFAIGERKPIENPRPPAPVFDDLQAAMLYRPVEADPHRTPTPSAPGDFTLQQTPRHTLSFGGLEAQLRRRLELTPEDHTLRRQYAEALLDAGDREGGLNELEHLVQVHEGMQDLDTAGEIISVILRVVPLSVRHHQKRVEYAARSGNRPRLVDAYTELGDALFRCGEPEKARVVYSRVLELAPNNERAGFAIGMLSESEGLPRQSDEIPLIEAGVLGGSPSLTMVTLTPDALDALPAAELPSGVSEHATNDDDTASFDEEVDAAFAAPPPAQTDLVRRTSELVAVEEWAREQPEAPAPQVNGNFVDLGDWLREDNVPRSTRMVAAGVAPSGDEAADFAEMLRRFKAGVDENVDAEDYASHYDLGVAFKEMGLVDEAIGQFQRSLRGESHRVRSYEALGQCFVEKGQNQVALSLLQRAAERPGTDELSLVGVLYLCGYASEQVGRQQDAVRYYQRVFAVDIGFRDVSARLAALERTPQ